MSKLIRIPIVFSFFLALAACGGETHESLADELMGEVDTIAILLGDVTDALSFSEVRDDIIATGERMGGIAERVSALGDADPEVDAALQARFSGPDSPMLKLQGEIARVSRLMGGAAMVSVIQGAMSNLESL